MEHKLITRHIVSRETFEQTGRLAEKHREALESYLDQLLWWNKRINLVSRNVPRETVWEHVLHSLLLAPFPVFQQASLLVDAGTGGGLPGLPLAIAHPGKRFILNDNVSKKTVAVKQMTQKLGLNNVTISKESIERLVMEKPFLLVTKHAFKIDELWKMVREKPWTEMVFYKGLDFEDELVDIPAPLLLECHRLTPDGPGDFYLNKALIIIKRKEHGDT